MPAAQVECKQTPSGPGTGADRKARTLIDALPWPCIVFTRDAGTMVACNAALRDEFPQLDESPSRHAFEALFEHVDDTDENPMMYACRTRRWYRLDHRTLPPDGATEAFFLTNMSECVESLQRHREQHEQLLSTSRAMSVGEMATTLAHELNQPLAATINYLSGCASMASADPEQAPLLEGIQLAQRQAERAAKIIGSIREFVRSREPHRENVDVGQVVHNVTELLRLETTQQRVRIINALPDDLPLMFADRVMIEQVLLNLIKNAIEAMRKTPPQKRRITVSARVDYDDMVELRVVDQGCGFDGDDMDQLFAPLYTTKTDGLGIGLAICRSIIEYHEGRLFAEPNEEDGRGCAMVFTLPRGRDA